MATFLGCVTIRLVVNNSCRVLWLPFGTWSLLTVSVPVCATTFSVVVFGCHLSSGHCSHYVRSSTVGYLTAVLNQTVSFLQLNNSFTVSVSCFNVCSRLMSISMSFLTRIPLNTLLRTSVKFVTDERGWNMSTSSRPIIFSATDSR